LELCDGTLSELSALSNAATEASLVSGVPVPAGVKIFDEAAVIEVLTHVCRALRYAHARNVAHLDVKPDNVLHRRGAYKLADWGRAAPVDAAARATAAGAGAVGAAAGAAGGWFPSRKATRDTSPRSFCGATLASPSLPPLATGGRRRTRR
jgi:serine/threonine protein kinase